MRSLSSWRAWIEMRILLSTCKRRPSRSPHGERGLKYRRVLAGVFARLSLSSWRAWIEIPSGWRLKWNPKVALLMESVD